MTQTTPGGPEIWIRGPVGAADTSDNISTEPSHTFTQREVHAIATASGEAAFSWMNAHGGAGASTLTAVFGGFDCGGRWPETATGESGKILLVARTHASGLQAVSQVLDMIRRDEQPSGVTLQAVVLVADAPGRLPPELARRIKVIGSVTAVHRIPWMPDWRMGNLSGPAPRGASALSKLLTSQ
ncbi:hypothetical protein ACIPRL_03960 [Streptomyces sp. NPDC090085]|uniref:hypothetical protein n=1 Tax=unclassified Streptomyces TaxID=2593676 RepID=UPI003822E284